MIEWREEENTAAASACEIVWQDMEQIPEMYRRLGIKPGISSLQIKQAYRRLAKECHPDCQPASLRSAAEQRMLELNAAYEVLGNSEQRARYDAMHGLAQLT